MNVVEIQPTVEVIGERMIVHDDDDEKEKEKQKKVGEEKTK